MIGIVKTTLAGLAIGVMALAAATPATAQDWHRHRGYHQYHHDRGGDMLAAGILGAAVGAVASGVLAPAPVYVDPYPRYPTYYRAPPRVVYVEPAPEPWTRAWYDDCAARYRSFDPGSGAFLGYDGQSHFCTLN